MFWYSGLWYGRDLRFDVPQPSCNASSLPVRHQAGRFNVPEPVVEV